jgi:hypothetical protein
VATTGNWYTINQSFPELKKVSGGNVGGVFPDAGALYIHPSDDSGETVDGYRVFATPDKFDPFSGTFTAEHECMVILKQEWEEVIDTDTGNILGTRGEGWLIVDCDISAGTPALNVTASNSSENGNAPTVTHMGGNVYRVESVGVSADYLTSVVVRDGADAPLPANFTDIAVIDYSAPTTGTPCTAPAIPTTQCETHQGGTGGFGSRSPSTPDSFFYGNYHTIQMWHTGAFSVDITIEA